MTKMQASVFRGVGQMDVAELEIGKPGPHEVLIRTAAAGVCHSDLHFMEGKYPHPLPAVLGHEAAGVVEAVGSEVRDVKPGDHVITCLVGLLRPLRALPDRPPGAAASTTERCRRARRASRG